MVYISCAGLERGRIIHEKLKKRTLTSASTSATSPANNISSTSPPHEIISWIRACICLSTINKHHSKINKNNTRIKKSMNIKYIFWYMFIFFFISRSTSAPWKVVRWWGAFSFCVWHGGSQRRKVNIISSGSKFTQLLPRYLINLNLFLVNYLCFLHALYCFDYIT